MTFLPCMRLMRWRRSFARWQASLDCPKGTSRAGAPSIFSKAEATCTKTRTSHRTARHDRDRQEIGTHPLLSYRMVCPHSHKSQPRDWAG